MTTFSVSEFLEQLTPSNLVTLSSIYDLEDIKSFKNDHLCKGRCKCKNTSKWFCSKCGVLNKLLCRSYHGVTDFDELIIRIVYEYMFDIITLDDIANEKWMGMCNRDSGHCERIKRLVSRVPPSRLATCKWLVDVK